MEKPKIFPNQQQSQPGDQNKMNPEPEIIRKNYKGSEKLKGKTALITGGDSGIGSPLCQRRRQRGDSLS